MPFFMLPVETKILLSAGEIVVKSRGVAIVCEEPALMSGLRKQFSKSAVLPLEEFLPNGTSVILVAKSQNLPGMHSLMEQMSFEAKTGSILTCRLQSGESVPLQQPVGTVVLPYCTNEVFAHWIALLQGVQISPIFPEWFFRHNPIESQDNTVQRLHTVLQNLMRWNSSQLLVPNVAEAIKCSPRHLQQLFVNLFGVKPGLLLRALDLFARTAQILRQETGLCSDSRRGYSPLREREDDYARRLKRLLGITYTELRQSGKTEHWAAIWMRQWRQRLLQG